MQLDVSDQDQRREKAMRPLKEGKEIDRALKV